MRLFALLFLILFSSPAFAEAPQHATARLVSPVTGVGTDSTVPALVEITLEQGWKTYWRTPGDAGLAPVFDWSGSSNFMSAAVSLSAPHRFTAYGLDNFGYEDKAAFPVSVTAAEAGKAVSLKLKLDILVCSDICLPETHMLSLDIPAGAGSASAAAGAYKDALASVPHRQDGFFTRAYLSYDRTNVNYLIVETSNAAAEDADIFVEHGSGIAFGKPEISHVDGETVYIAPIRSSDSLEKIGGQLAASPLTLTYVGGGTAIESSIPISPRPGDGIAPVERAHPAKAAAQALGGLKIALFAFIGGLILNLMPCVLPVLSLKLLSVIAHGSASRGAVFRNFTASAAGIMFSFWLLAAGVSMLKAAGETVGWGIQFQNPAFLVFLITLVLLFAANMWGLFEIPLPRFIARRAYAKGEEEPTLAGHFLSGAFATLLATPCTAPFLGPAVGFALARETGEIFSVFTMIGLGLAAPYLVLAVSPALLRMLPRPGRWMVTLKKVLAGLLVLTAAWLANVLVVISTAPALDEGWQAFDEALIAPAVADGKIVVVDVTADWCLTCKANKRLVLDQKDIVDALSGPEIMRLQADWTQRDESIAAYLQSFGRYGIPFDVVYGPGAPDGIVLPELLGKKVVLDALAEAAGE